MIPSPPPSIAARLGVFASLLIEPEGEAEYSWKSGGLPSCRTGAPRIGAPRVHAPGELGERRGGREAQEVFGGFGATCFFGDFGPRHPWRGPCGRAEARPILLPAKLSLHEQRQIRRDRIWTAEGCQKGEDQGWSESKSPWVGGGASQIQITRAKPARLSGFPLSRE